MRVLRCIALVSLFLAICIPVFADEGSKTCSPVGTWYGGSAVKYQLTVMADGADKYTFIFDPGFQNPAFPIATKFTGVMVKKGHKFLARGMGLFNVDTSFPPAPPVIWALE